MARYEIDCHDCGEQIGETNDPREAYDIAQTASGTEHGTSVAVTARGLINRAIFSRANKDR